MLPALFLLTSAPGLAEPLEIGAIETVAEGFQFTEGPVWIKDKLVFSDIPADIIYNQDKTKYRTPSGKSNGLTLDGEGRLIACEHWNRRVTRGEHDGSITVLADQYEDKKLNSPNDVVVRSDGAIFFTDPMYGLEGRPAELPFAGVYMLSPDGTLRVIAKDFDKPNGLAFSPDEKILYIADTGRGHVRAFDTAQDGTLAKDREFCKLPHPDGIKVDTAGNLWSTSSLGIYVFAPSGDPLGEAHFPQIPANCGFGDADAKTMYVTARTAIYKVRIPIAGILPGPAK